MKTYIKRITNLFMKKYSSCHLISIDINKDSVSFCVGSIVLSRKVSNVVYDRHLLSQMQPHEACMLGLNYGILSSKLSRNPRNKENQIDFFIVHNKSRYCVDQITRNGKIGYLDTKTGSSYIESPATITDNRHIIDRFDSSQACYIGILAGARIKEEIANGKIKAEKPILRLVS